MAVRVATQGFTTPIGVVSVELSTGLYNVTTDGVLAAFICKDMGAQINLLTQSLYYAGHFSMPSSSQSQRSALCFADDVAPKFGSGEKMAIYMSSAGTGSVNNRAAILATIRYFSLT